MDPIKKPKVLLVDDHKENQIALSRLLDSINVSYDSAMDGEEAIQLLEDKEYAVILLDIQMPKKNGFEVAQAMKAGGMNANSPFIFITGEEKYQKTKKTGYDHGASDYVLKPFDPQSLTHKIKTFCELYQLKKDRDVSFEQEKNTLLGKISHEIRTPMNGIMGNLQELLEKGGLSDEQLKLLKNIADSSKDLLGVVDKVVDYSLLKQGKLQLDVSVMNVRHEIGLVLKELEEQYRLTRNHLSIEIEPGVPEYIKVDGNKVIQIVKNIVENSLKFSSEGIVKIRVTNQKNETRSRLFFEVKDSGIGMESNLQNDIYRGFAQVHEDNSSEIRGAGLGLSISKGLIDLLQGDIYFTSEYGVGTTFYFSFTYDTCLKSELPNNRGGIEGVKFDLNVLVVEDAKVNQQVARMMLESYGCEVVCASHGVEALQLMNSNKYDLILMDIEMPVMNGYETINQIHLNWSKPPKIYAVTANYLEADKNKMKQHNFDAFMLKPMSKNDLIGYMFKDFSHKIRKG